MLRNMAKVLLALGVLATAGCVTDLFECTTACDHYDDCGGVLDVRQCADLCEDRSDLSEGFENQVEQCNDCLDELECSPSCNNVCDGVIPPF